MYPLLDKTGKRPVKSVASRSLGSRTLKKTFLDLGGGDRADCGVERTVFLFNFMWPFAVLRDLGRCLDMRSAVRPGQVTKNQDCIAVMKVAGIGENKVRYQYMARSDFVDMDCSLFTKSGGVGSGARCESLTPKMI